MAALNIKDEKACRMARELARRTGESVTAAVHRAVQERLERIRRSERIRAIAKECAAHVKEPFKSLDHGELLYNEKGLPK